jgi:hypothetical protein
MIERKLAQLNRDFDASLIEVNGDISKSANGCLIEDKYEVGPDPMERPKRIMSDSLIPIH